MMKTKILYEDTHILIIHKPAGIAVQSAQIGQMDVESELRNYLARQMRAQPQIHVIHRLDQPVEGLLVFAKTKAAAAGLNKQLAAGTLNKNYYAVICGQPTRKQDELVDYMKKSGNLACICSQADREAKKAVLQYRIMREAAAEGTTGNLIEKTAGNSIEETAEKKPDFSLADIRIETGRFHQIRCQMAHHGMPLLGDTKYGTEDSKELSRKLGIRQVALCAYKLECIHPMNGKHLSYQVHPENPAFAPFK